MVLPVSTMSSTTITDRPSMFSCMPITSLTLPVEPCAFVAFEADKRDFGVGTHLSEQVGGKRERTVEHAHKQRVLPLVLAGKLFAEAGVCVPE